MKRTELGDGCYMVDNANGNKEWYRNGQLHREDGPAIEHPNGYKAWCRNGKLHREDGPAIEYSTGGKAWWRNGEQLPQEFVETYEALRKERDALKEHEQELTYYNGTLARESHNLQVERDDLKARLAKHEEVEAK